MKRSAWLWQQQGIRLGTRGVTIWGYDKRGRFVCRVEINGAGLAAYAGKRGRKKLANVSWENLVKRLTK